MNPPPAAAAFPVRLKLLLGPRRMTPWASALQIPSGTMTRMFREGIPPTYETLSKMMRTENVSISWLLGAACPAYLYTGAADDDAMAEELEARVADETSWRVNVLTDGQACAIVLTQPASIEDAKGSRLNYTAVEVICGPCGERTAAVIAIAPPKCAGQLVRISHAQMRQIYQDGVGTFQLLGGQGVPGLLDAGEPGPFTMDTLATCRAEAGGWNPREHSRDGLPHTLERMLQVWSKFTDAERQAIGVVVEPLMALAEHRLDPLALSTGYRLPGGD